MSGRAVLGLWEWHPSVLVGCFLLGASYLTLAKPRSAARTASFLAGDLVLLVALVSPLDGLGDEVLFSAHMLQHILLALVAPPLLILGLPAATMDRLLARPTVARAARALGRPAVAWPLFVGTLWAWHAPPLYDVALRHEGLHIVEHLSFIVTGVVFWWPVAGPLPAWRMNASASVFYLFFAGLANTLLGIVVTFAPRVLYTFYLNPPDPDGVLLYFRRVWGLWPKADQAMGGVLMWTGGMVIFAIALAVRIGAMLHESGGQDAENGITAFATGSRTG